MTALRNSKMSGIIEKLDRPTVTTECLIFKKTHQTKPVSQKTNLDHTFCYVTTSNFDRKMNMQNEQRYKTNQSIKDE